jgi:hypothetical protein
MARIRAQHNYLNGIVWSINGAPMVGGDDFSVGNIVEME